MTAHHPIRHALFGVVTALALTACTSSPSASPTPTTPPWGTYERDPARIAVAFPLTISIDADGCFIAKRPDRAHVYAAVFHASTYRSGEEIITPAHDASIEKRYTLNVKKDLAGGVAITKATILTSQQPWGSAHIPEKCQHYEWYMLI